MPEPIPFKKRPAKDDYPVFIKMVDGKPVEVVDIDSLTESQFKKFCADTGTEWFQRLSITTR